jgi:hypothetical protein
VANLITPPDDLIRDWARFQNHKDPEALWRRIATLAARWGADQELEACVAWLDGYEREGWAAQQLRSARRPKPPSLKEQALAALDRMHRLPTLEDSFIIRDALEALND